MTAATTVFMTVYTAAAAALLHLLLPFMLRSGLWSSAALPRLLSRTIVHSLQTCPLSCFYGT